MGLSASEARFLSLTARKSDLELEAQQISSKRAQLADNMDVIQTEYSDKMNNRILMFKNPADKKQQVLDYSCISSKDNAYYLTTSGGKRVFSSQKEADDSGLKLNEYVVDDRVLKSGYLEDRIRDGIYFITRENTDEESDDKHTQLDISGVPEITDEFDEADDAAAQADYDAKMKRAQKEDKKLELRLNDIETAHKAIETEMDSVDKVMKQNIENTYKTFGNG